MAGDPSSKEGPAPVARPRDPLSEYLRIGLGVAILLIVVLSGLAFINSFFLEPPAPTGPRGSPAPTTAQAGDSGGGGDGRTCERIVASLRVFFFILTTAMVVAYGLAIARRGKHDNRIATNPWGILATVLFFASILFLGLWRMADFVCNESPNCLNMTNGAYTTYLFLMGLTLAGVGGGMLLAHLRRRAFFSTGFGLIGVVLYIPAILSGFAWYIIRLVCSPRLSCAVRDQFLDTLLTTFWLALAGGLVAIFCGVLVMRARKIDLFRSGWGVLAILLIALSMLAGGGWKLASDIEIPGCDPITPGEEPTCESIKADLQRTLRDTITTLVVLALVMGAGFFFYRRAPRKFFTSPFAVIGYVLLMLAGLTWLLLIFSGTLCGEADPPDDPPDATPTGSPTPGSTGTATASPGPTSTGGTTGSPGPTGSSGPTSRPATSSNPGGGGGGGGSSGGGGGSGGRGVGPPQVPLELGTIPLVWVLVIVAALVLAALLILLLRHRKVVLDRLPKSPPAAQVQAAERASLLRMLDNTNLRSAEAVIAAYRGFLAWCAQRNLGKGPEETPLEHAERVRTAYPVPEDPMRAFIAAYEVARLSTREPTPAERQNAVRFARDIDTVAWSKDSEDKA